MRVQTFGGDADDEEEYKEEGEGEVNDVADEGLFACARDLILYEAARTLCETAALV